MQSIPITNTNPCQEHWTTKENQTESGRLMNKPVPYWQLATDNQQLFASTQSMLMLNTSFFEWKLTKYKIWKETPQEQFSFSVSISDWMLWMKLSWKVFFIAYTECTLFTAASDYIFFSSHLSFYFSINCREFCVFLAQMWIAFYFNSATINWRTT